MNDIAERWTNADLRYILILPAMEEGRSVYMLDEVTSAGRKIVWTGDTFEQAFKAAVDWEAKGFFVFISRYENHTMHALSSTPFFDEKYCGAPIGNDVAGTA